MPPRPENNDDVEPSNSDNQTRDGKGKHHVSLRGRWKRTATVNKMIAIATIIGAASTLAYAVFAAMQWNEIRKGSTDTHELAVQAKNQADRTKDIADAAKAQSEQAKAQTEKMKESLVKTDNLIRATSDLATVGRGELAIHQKEFSLEHGGQLDVSMGLFTFDPQTQVALQIQPLAGGIAKEMDVYAIVESLPKNMPPPFAKYDTGAARVNGYDCQVMNKISRENCTKVGIIMTPNPWPSFRAGKKWLYVHGHVRFNDGRSPQEFRFCRYISREDYASSGYVPPTDLQLFSHDCRTTH